MPATGRAMAVKKPQTVAYKALARRRYGNADSDADQKIENASGSQQGLSGWIFDSKDQRRHGIKIPRRRPKSSRITAMTGEGHDQCDDRSDHRDAVASPKGECHDE